MNLQRLIDAACITEMRRLARLDETTALLACVELASTDGEHGVSKPREVVLVHYRMSGETAVVLR